ncbi:MAG: hypothetical protein IKT33_02690 [Clostridia bacterium]|nr:hypothetical protein [Clostridia bacterium]
MKKNKFTKAKNNFKKGLLIAATVAGIGANTALFTGCPNPNGPSDPNKDPNKKPGTEKDYNEKYGTPCDKVLGNGEFVIHNFIGEDDYLKPATIAEDVNYYLGKAETYMQDKIDDFEKSLKGDAYTQNYFNDFIAAQRSNNFNRLGIDTSKAYGIDETINGITEPCLPIFEDFIRSIDNNRDRCIFIEACQAIFNESYKYGLGAYRDKETPLDEKYDATRQTIRKSWNAKTINAPYNIDTDIDEKNCQQTTQELSRIASAIAANKGIKKESILSMINLASTTYSLEAMDDRAASDLKHRTCNSAAKLIIDKMDSVAYELYKAEQQVQKSRQVQTSDNTMGK